MDWVALPQLGAKSRWRQDGGTALLQVSGPGLSGGCGKMLRERVSLQVSVACGEGAAAPAAAAASASTATPGLCRRTGGGDKEVVSQQEDPPAAPPTAPPVDPSALLSLCHDLGSGGAGR